MSVARLTIASPICLTGNGLFTNEPGVIKILPSTKPSGICFVSGTDRIPVHISRLSTRPVHLAFEHMPPRCTSIGNGIVNIATIEHLMSALTGLGITDADLQITGPEIPILDGSALPFVEAIINAGTQNLDQTIEPITIKEIIRVTHNDASITIEPAESPSYTYTLDYGSGSPIQASAARWSGDQEAYIKHIAPARTFCLKAEADAMRDAGLFTHLTPRDMLVIGSNGPIENEYRFASECATHKLLDLIGDLALVGAPLSAKVSAEKSGHALAHQAARAILEQINTD
ncbi:MAG: UDP-3-O-acyl-N-acetylglucosamine deacetylase [Phycisphaerales bacterium]|nr:UDP-3-O-acyl-N-acetylglucosamine deacetylase [Phycisphaerales bacterium]